MNEMLTYEEQLMDAMKAFRKIFVTLINSSVEKWRRKAKDIKQIRGREKS